MAAPPGADHKLTGVVDKLLETDPSATPQQIRQAYKRAALKYHPDRVPATSPDRASRTRKFQQINDAYYTLSDARRRREYDEARRASKPPPQPRHDTPEEGASFASSQFEEIFEEMLREEGPAMAEGEGGVSEERKGYLWSIVGGLSGAGLGFIVANVPGMLAGAVAGNRLGAIRDQKGKSVYTVFQELPQDDRARILGQLAARVLQSAVG